MRHLQRWLALQALHDLLSALRISTEMLWLQKDARSNRSAITAVAVQFSGSVDRSLRVIAS
jgi:hypothetical protein